ncbi:dynein regulatory complex protein 8-like [Centruroides vittatus]|uniref:dynein regulatory complex protein 8-like n=1 Tax=Centruroides vittatus TaxID=120091 RepID=UPI00350F08ED
MASSSIQKSSRLSPYDIYLKERIVSVFKLFDKENNDTINSDDLGAFIRCLYLCPMESEIDDVLKMVENPENPGTIHIERIMPVMLDIMKTEKFKPVDAELLKEAFEYLDREKKHYLTEEEAKQIFTKYGEPFTKEEMDNMLDFAVSSRDNRIYYQNYLSQSVITEEEYLKGKKSNKD